MGALRVALIRQLTLKIVLSAGYIRLFVINADLVGDIDDRRMQRRRPHCQRGRAMSGIRRQGDPPPTHGGGSPLATPLTCTNIAFPWGEFRGETFVAALHETVARLH